jgi:hypothetical protein
MEAAAATLDRRKKMETHQTSDRLFVPRWEDVEVDKIPGYWILTLTLPDRSTLRLKVRQTCSEEPNDCIAEVKLHPDEEFQAISEFSIAVYEIAPPEGYPDLWNDMPSQWARGFATLAHIWIRLTNVAVFGPSVSEGCVDPHSSPRPGEDKNTVD